MAIPTTLLANSSHISTTGVIPSLVEEGTRGIVSDDMRDIFTFIFSGLICGILVIFGSIVNIINIVVFFRIGFKETIHISLMSIAISDFFCCLTMIFDALCYNPAFTHGTILCYPEPFWDLPGWLHIVFARITSCLTAFITLERCLCVAAPLKVKEIITPKRVVIFIICVNVFVTISISPNFVPVKDALEFVRYNKDLQAFKFIVYPIHGIIIPFATFLVVVISAFCLVVTLKRNTAWRKSAAQDASSSLSPRDAKVSKMVVRIAILFILCYLPTLFSYLAGYVEPEYNLGLKYHNLCVIIFALHFALESTNSSLNIFIYYSTSSIYKAAFLKLFCREK